MARRLNLSWLSLHRGEGVPVALAATAAFMSELSEAFTANCADALYLGRHGAGGLGALLALSAVALAATLATVGAVADRWPRERILAGIGIAGALILVGVRLALVAWPSGAPAALVVIAKQISAALDLGIWVLVADRFDARQGRRVVPLLLAAGGVGLVGGSWATQLVVSHMPVEDLLILGAVGCLGAGIAGGALGMRRFAAGAARTRIVGFSRPAHSPAVAAGARVADFSRPGHSPAVAGVGGSITHSASAKPAEVTGVASGSRSPPGSALAPAAASSAGSSRFLRNLASIVTTTFRDGARATRQSELARRLALTVTVAGAFGPVIYTALGAAAGKSLGGEAELAAFFGKFRGLTSIATLVAQAALAPRLLRFFGVGRSFLVAPIAALATGAALCLDAGLAIAVIAQAGARLVDAAIETPAEKLAQNLLPRGQRGRIGGFLEGVAKRAGALGGGLAVTLIVARPRGIGLLSLAIGGAWLLVALTLHRRYPVLAVAALAARRSPAGDGTKLDESDLRLLAADLGGADERRRALAIEVLLRHAPEQAVPVLLTAARASASGRSALIAALDRVLEVDPAARRGVPGAAAQILVFLDAKAAPLERANLVQAFSRLAGEVEFTSAGARFATLAADAEPAVSLAAQAALARRQGADTVDAVLARGLRTARDTAAMALLGAGPSAEQVAALRVIVVEELRAEALAGRAFPIAALAGLAESGDDSERAAALTALAEAARRSPAHHDAIRAAAQDILDDVEAPPSVRAAALAALGGLCDARLAPALTRALAARDDELRDAGAAGLAALGVAALPALLTAARFGRRIARDAALDLLGELSVSPAALDGLVDAELRALRETALHRHVLSDPAGESAAGSLLLARLDERIAEIARTLLLVVQAREPRSAAGVRRVLAARDPHARAQALEALDAVLPRALALRVIPELDDAPAEDRAARAADALGVELPAAHDVIRAELASGDLVVRVILVRVLGRAGLAAHRESIRDAAGASVGDADPVRLLRRIHQHQPSEQEQEPDLPGFVEAMNSLREIEIFRELGPSQLAALAEVVSWESHAAGDEIAAHDGVVVVYAGRVRTGVAEIAAGACYGAPSLFGAIVAPVAVAVERSRLIRLDRADFEQVVEDNPAIALAICRVLARPSNP